VKCKDLSLAKFQQVIQMKRFSISQKWINEAALCGRFFGEVIETSAQGRRGTVVITDDKRNVLCCGIPGFWRVATNRRVSTIGLYSRLTGRLSQQ
jgi:hypothetical protein